MSLDTLNIGWIGAGKMGGPMSRNVVAAVLQMWLLSARRRENQIVHLPMRQTLWSR